MDRSMPLPGTVTSLTNTETPVRTGLPRPGQGIGYPNQTPVCPLRQSEELQRKEALSTSSLFRLGLF